MERIITMLLLVMVIALGSALSYAEVLQEFEPSPAKETIQGDNVPISTNQNCTVISFIEAIIAASEARLQPQLTPETGILYLPILWIEGERYTDVIIILNSENNTWMME